MIYQFSGNFLLNKIEDEIAELSINHIVGLSKSSDTLYVETSSALSPEQIADIQEVATNHDPNDADYLREYIEDVTPRQFRQALALSGVIDSDVVEMLNTQDEPVRTLALIEWEYSTAFKRNNPLVIQLAPALGYTAGQLDELWILAASL